MLLLLLRPQCFNHLLLPGYHSKESLRGRLEMALENSEGFGLL